MKHWMFSILIFLGSLSPTLAQTYSSEEVVVSGIDFSRFSAELKVDQHHRDLSTGHNQNNRHNESKTENVVVLIHPDTYRWKRNREQVERVVDVE